MGTYGGASGEIFKYGAETVSRPTWGQISFAESSHGSRHGVDHGYVDKVKEENRLSTRETGYRRNGGARRVRYLGHKNDRSSERDLVRRLRAVPLN